MKDGAESGLFERVAGRESSDLPQWTEAAWIDVVHQMDAVYADLLRYEVELEQKNQRLEDAQNFISGVISSISDVLVVCDSRGRIQQVNRAFEDLMGVPHNGLLHNSLPALFAPESRVVLESYLATQGASRVNDREMSLLGKGGAVLLAVNCSPRYDNRKRFKGMVVIGRSIGELRKAYEALRIAHQELKVAQQQIIHAEKLASLGRLIAGVAHELNNPISYVYANIFSLKQYASKIKEYMQSVDSGMSAEQARDLKARLGIDRVVADLEPLVDGTMNGAERVRDIVNDLRRYSSAQREKHRAVQLEPLVRSATHAALRGMDIPESIEFDVPADLLVLGHEHHLHQVIVNLVQNAHSAVADAGGPCIWIGAKRESEFVVLQVRDNGVGIPAEVLPRIFDPFFTTKEVGEGTGLGLWICEAIVREHGGAISVASDSEGGTAFTVRLRPATREDDESSASQ